jgi:prophage regulatory protein
MTKKPVVPAAAPLSGDFLRPKEVCALLRCSLSSLYARRNPKNPAYNPEFPAPIRFGTRCVLWDRAELMAYLEKLPRSMVGLGKQAAKQSEVQS